MKKIILLLSAILLTLCIFISCDNGIAFVNDIEPIPSSEGYSTVIFVTAEDKEKIYDPNDPQGRIEPDPELTYTSLPEILPPGVVFTGSLIRVAGEEAGEYDIKQGSLALAGENASQYTLVFIGAKLTIYEKGVITIIANNKSKFEDDPDPEFDYYIAPSAESLRLSFGITIEGALARTAGETPGDYTIGQGTLHHEGPDAGDWRIEFTPGVFHIANAGEILVVAISFEKFYGEADPIFTYVLSPAALPSGLSLTGALNREAGEVAGDYYIRAGTLALSGSATDGKPYHLKFNELTPDSGNLATLTIKKKTVTVTATSFTRVFNSEFPDFTYSNNQNLPDTAFTGALTCEAASMANVGVFAIKQGTLALSDTTDGAGGRYVDNYTMSFVNGTLNITDNNIINVSANPQTKFYGDDDPVLSYTPAEALPAGLSFTGVPTRDIGENVGTYAIKQGSLALTGTNAEHYTIAFVNSTLSIEQKELRVIPSTGQSKIYKADDPVNLTFSTSPMVDIASAFGSTKLNRAAGEVVGTYAIKADNLALQGAYATNYYISFDNTKTFAVTPCPVVIAIYPTSKVRDDDDPEFNYAVTPSELMNVPSWKTTVFKGSFTRDAGEAEGLYTIRQRTAQEEGNTDATKKVQLIGDYALNYQITTIQTGTFQITPPGPVNISDPVKYMKPIITELHDTYAQAGATFRKADGPLRRDPGTGEYPDNVKGETFLGSFAYWYDSDDNTVYYYYGGPVYLYGDCHNLFEGCYKYTTMDMTGFNTQYVTNMSQMFFLCYNVTKLDLSGWSFNNVSNMANMFDRCERLTEIDFSDGGVDMSKVTYMNWMFAHNFYMTPTDLRNIIKQWKLKNNGDVNTIFTDEFSNSTTDKLRNNDNSPNAAGANRLISNDMVKNNPGKIVSSEIKKYIKDRDIPDSNGYSGTPPSAAFKTDFNAYYSGDNVDNGPEEPKGVKLYLGDPSTVKGQRMNLIPAGSR
ncbi:MAG: BspA family leucine-rich repeat surface protein [Spirochaetia bacterium]|nr:BspA family leucine-rich repeat surface protein [Spirochaetia bacterium]